jgi:hypothetical protein
MYKIEIFGMPVSSPSEYELREAAIERAKRELATKEYPADATVADKATNQVVWSGALSRDGGIVER